MLRKTLLVTLMFLLSFSLVACKKKSTPAEAAEDVVVETPAETAEDVVVKTQAEYEAEAENEITAENMDAELEELEKSMEAELQQEPESQ